MSETLQAKLIRYRHQLNTKQLEQIETYDKQDSLALEILLIADEIRKLERKIKRRSK